MQVRLDPPDGVDPVEYAERHVARALNAGEPTEVCRVFSTRPVPVEELGEEDDDAWLETPERYGTDSDGALVENSILTALGVPKGFSSGKYSGTSASLAYLSKIERERRETFAKGIRDAIRSIEDIPRWDVIDRLGAVNSIVHAVRAACDKESKGSQLIRMVEELVKENNRLTSSLEESVKTSSFRTMYPIGKLTNYYGPGHEDLTVLREAFRDYIEDDAAEHYATPQPGQVDQMIDDAVRRVVERRGAKKESAQKTNQDFVNVMLQAVKANTETQFHCKKHGEVMAFARGNGDLFCPECYNESLGKIEDMHFREHLDKAIPQRVKLPERAFKVGGATSGQFEVLSVRVAKPLAEYIRRCGEEALVYGCEVVAHREDDDDA
jgi:hypothetical protein